MDPRADHVYAELRKARLRVALRLRALVEQRGARSGPAPRALVLAAAVLVALVLCAVVPRAHGARPG